MTTQLTQTNTQVSAQSNNALALTEQLEQLKAQLATLSQRLAAPTAPETSAPAAQ